jgi:hypothetical protein
MMSNAQPDHDLIALSIQQPWAELILQGLKTIEVRTFPARRRGRIYLYAGKQFSSRPCARTALQAYNLKTDALPCGVIVGTVEILDCRESHPDDAVHACVEQDVLRHSFSWILGSPRRCPQLWAARCLPYGPWFYPFHRIGASTRRRRDHGGT